MYFRNTKIYFQSTKVYSRSTKVYSPSTKVYFQSTSILSKNKSLLWKYKSILWRKNPKTRLLSVLFDSIDLLALFGVYAGIIFEEYSGISKPNSASSQPKSVPQRCCFETSRPSGDQNGNFMSILLATHKAQPLPTRGPELFPLTDKM